MKATIRDVAKYAGVSNLNIENVEQSHCYKIHGTSSSICIFSGFLSEQRIGESICYRAKYNVRTDYAALYEKMFTLGAFIDARNGIVEMKNQDTIIYSHKI